MLSAQYQEWDVNGISTDVGLELILGQETRTLEIPSMGGTETWNGLGGLLYYVARQRQ